MLEAVCDACDSIAAIIIEVTTSRDPAWAAGEESVHHYAFWPFPQAAMFESAAETDIPGRANHVIANGKQQFTRCAMLECPGSSTAAPLSTSRSLRAGDEGSRPSEFSQRYAANWMLFDLRLQHSLKPVRRLRGHCPMFAVCLACEEEPTLILVGA